MQVTLKGIKPPPGWVDLGIIGVEGVVCCIDCGADVAEHVAEWLLQRVKELEASRSNVPQAAKDGP
jgi:hypothetical protein